MKVKDQSRPEISPYPFLESISFDTIRLKEFEKLRVASLQEWKLNSTLYFQDNLYIFVTW